MADDKTKLRLLINGSVVECLGLGLTRKWWFCPDMTRKKFEWEIKTPLWLVMLFKFI